jgi:uroporphyrinogen-III decarboxylase
MTSRERFLNIIRGEMPDRVPVTLFICDGGHFLNQLHPEIDPWDHERQQLKVIEVQKQFGADVFVRMLYGVNDPLFIHMGGVNVNVQTADWEVRTEELRHGETRVQRSVVRTPGGTLTQDFSIYEVRPGTFVFACTKKPVECEADLDLAIRYEPRMPECWRQQVKERVARIRAALGDAGILGTWTPHGPFNNASLLIDLDTLYSLFRVDYPFYEKLMNFAMERILDYTAAIDDAGPDVHCVGGNVPGGFLGRANYERYILPFERKYIEFVQRNGRPAMYHNCGQVMALVESYKQLGVRMVEPFSPPPLGDADLAKVKAAVGNAYAILSGIDQVNVLQGGTVEQVRRATRETIQAGKPGGGFILQPVDFLEYGTPEENVEAYVREALEHAWY